MRQMSESTTAGHRREKRPAGQFEGLVVLTKGIKTAAASAQSRLATLLELLPSESGRTILL